MFSRSSLLAFCGPTLVLTALLSAGGCNATNKPTPVGGGGAGGSTNNGTAGDELFGGGSPGTGGGPLQTEPPCEGVDPNIDNDGDGYTGAAGDCNDCTTQMNPGAQDYPGNNIDEDCNGAKDDNPANCDAPLGLASPDPMDGARALGLCKVAQGPSWGVVSAQYITADGQALTNYDPQGLGHGILPSFGTNVKPQEGAKMLVLSSGAARQPSDPGFFPPEGYDKFYSTGSPPGYPKESPACPGVTTGEPYDSAGLRLVIKTPTNAKSLTFNLNFYTFEFPGFICSEYNDFFVAMLSPKPGNQVDGNISYDSKGNTISVNAGFLQVCHPQTASNGVFFDCPLGPDQLTGTGFDQYFGSPTDNSAATAWLQTTSPVETPGQNITVDFAIWDSGDGILDSTVLLDNFQFGLDDTPTVTEPIPDPK
ncbi:MAG: choice-of-anchor L domain-containing protein [Polyangiaceae bacterium]|nr:choice-of-anchor L domain-containing protein [Polyangiaceae bacterium]